LSVSSGGKARAPVFLRELRTRRVLGLALLGGLAGAVIFGLLGEQVQDQEPIPVDSGAAQFLHGYSSPLVDTVMLVASFLGSGWFVIPLLVLTVLLLLKVRRLDQAVFLSIAYAGSGAINYVLKSIFHRVRPELPWSPGSADYGFPSGHAMNSFVFYVALGMVVWTVPGRRLGLLVLAGGLLLVLLVGISRVYLGYHYVSDVIGGYSAGLLWLLIWTGVLRGTWARVGSYRAGRRQRASGPPAA
jgi:membrane-associated phospholipid phosphatase